MATLNTVFKQVFSEGLKEEGFVKIKGRQPYLVRVIGNEIIHVITCRNEWCGEPGLKEFTIYGGIATVYRLKIDLTCNPVNNFNWLNCLSEIYQAANPLTYNERYQIMLMEFLYKKDNGNSLFSQMRKAFRETKKIMLPIFNNVMNLESCIEYYRTFNSTLINIPDFNDTEPHFGYDDCNEGLLYKKTNNHDDLISVYQKIFSVTEREIKMGRAKGLWDSLESASKFLEEWRVSTIVERDKIYNTPYIYEKALEELKIRKKTNKDLLRSYGLNI